MGWMAKRSGATALACTLLLATAAAAAQTSSADRCMSLSTDDARLDCMRSALERAERVLQDAGIGAVPGSPAAKGRSIDGAVTDDAHKAAATGLAALGVEQVSSRDATGSARREERRYRATIVSFRERLPGQARFEFDNGQVWQQTAADAQRVALRAGEPVQVELWSTWSGGYRMLLPDQRQIVKVERVR